MVGRGLLTDSAGVYLRGVLCEREMEDEEVVDGLRKMNPALPILQNSAIMADRAMVTRAGEWRCRKLCRRASPARLRGLRRVWPWSSLWA